jgi:peptidoglycan hydrolase-like protein with peptidoglycan-binding domain
MKNLRNKMRVILEQYESYTDFVKAAQTKLKELGYNLGKSGPNRDGVDGIIGKLTKIAIKDFQLKNGGNGKGVLGPYTSKKLGIPYFEGNQEGTVPSDSGLTKRCGRYVLYPTVKDTLNDVCKGKENVAKKGPIGCSQYVASQTGVRQGNAWHAYRLSNSFPNKGDGFSKIFKGGNLNEMADIFSQINQNSKGLSENQINSSGQFGRIKSLISQAVPSQSSFSDLDLGDVVGIYYPGSSHTGEAFFYGATGLTSKGERATNGPFFGVLEGGKIRAWQPSDMGKKLKFVPGDTLTKKGERFGFNTHLGFVGGKTPSGEPIIYHYVTDTLKATPLSQMGGEFNIVWARPAKA